MDNKISIDTKPVVPHIAIAGGELFSNGEIMERDKEQTHRLHEPTSITSHTDPITGNDVIDTAGHPYIVDGITTVYFESEQTRNAYLDTPVNHPVLMLGSNISPEDDRGG